MLRLMNSAMMPQDGTYARRTVPSEEWAREFSRLSKREPWRSYVGYPQTAGIVGGLLGLDIPVCRDQTELEDGDTIFVAKLRYRVNPQEKGGRQHGASLDDYEFCIVEYDSSTTPPARDGA